MYTTCHKLYFVATMCQNLASLRPNIGFILWVRFTLFLFLVLNSLRRWNHWCHMMPPTVAAWQFCVCFQYHTGCTFFIPSANRKGFVERKPRVLKIYIGCNKWNISRPDFHVLARCDTGWVFATWWFWNIFFQFYPSCDGLWFRCWARTAIRLNTMGVELRCGCEVGTNWMTVALLRMKRKPTAPWSSYHFDTAYRMCSTTWRFMIFCHNFKNHDT